MVPFAILGGFAGAKLVWAVEHLSVYEQSFLDLVFSRGGFSWFGGLIGGAAWLAGLAWLLIRWRRRGVTDAGVLGLYLVLAAGFRFVLEFIRVNPEVALGLTVAQWISAGVVLAGVAVLARRRTEPRAQMTAPTT